MGQAIIVACIGYFLCFLVLAIIWGVLVIMKKLLSGSEKPAVKPEPVPVAEKPAVQESAKTDDTELIAVLTAACAASLNTSAYNLKIKSFRQLSSGTNRWGMAGVNENLSNKLL